MTYRYGRTIARFNALARSSVRRSREALGIPDDVIPYSFRKLIAMIPDDEGCRPGSRHEQLWECFECGVEAAHDRGPPATHECACMLLDRVVRVEAAVCEDHPSALSLGV